MKGEVPTGPTGEDSVCECTVKTAVLSCAASSIDQSSVHDLTLKPATTLAIYDSLVAFGHDIKCHLGERGQSTVWCP